MKKSVSKSTMVMGGFFLAAIVIGGGGWIIIDEILFPDPVKVWNPPDVLTLLGVMGVCLGVSWIIHGPGFWLFKVDASRETNVMKWSDSDE